MECNYFNANSIATRIFMEDDKRYLFNETEIEQRAGKETSSALPEFAYICDLSMLSSQASGKNHFCDTFDSFYGSEFLHSDAEKYDDMSYSENSLYWVDSDNEKLKIVTAAARTPSIFRRRLC